MNFLNKSVCVKQWQAMAMLAMSGYAFGAIIAKLATALGL